MKEQDYITKWLNHELSNEELEEFKKLDSYSSLIKLSDYASHFKAPEFNQEDAFIELQNKLKQASKQKSFAFTRWRAIAAFLVISIGLFFLLQPADSSVVFETKMAQKRTLSLPDASQVTLNAGSSLTYANADWDRNVTLQGEGYFKVAAGSTFTVATDQGNVVVVGTEFIVKERLNVFEVICYEGKVDVLFDGKTKRLTPGTGLLVRGNKIKSTATSDLNPSWTQGISIFKSTPIGEVIDELQRQYNVLIELDNVPTNILFTGSFKHQNIVKALESITVPLTLEYEIIDQKHVRISK